MPAVVAQAFATLACLAEDRVWLGVGTGESLNEVPATGQDWPKFSERLGRLEESVELIRTAVARGPRSRSRASTTRRAWPRSTTSRRRRRSCWSPRAGRRPRRFAGRAGDGFITTSGKPPELYADSLLPALEQGARDAGRDPADPGADARGQGRLQPGPRPGAGATATSGPRWRCRPRPSTRPRTRWSSSSWPTRTSSSRSRGSSSRTTPRVVVEKVRPYVELGFRHLVFHSPAEDQEGFLDRFSAEVVSRAARGLQADAGAAAAPARRRPGSRPGRSRTAAGRPGRSPRRGTPGTSRPRARGRARGAWPRRSSPRCTRLQACSKWAGVGSTWASSPGSPVLGQVA